MKKNLVYAEDLIYELMLHPSRSLSKSLVRDCAKKVIAEKKVSVWQHVWNCIKGLFKS